ncbi:C39 family peptidase [Levilactobacillus angrenensis]|uniref:C39 family peptidase n=1 Tax=Levilactobacillus angrenensis TaxID=2486020 RepID=A0ABW1UBT8_9LACO|nr:C39 family peptidase [Levilactobacillus angrenensis]
MSNWVRVFSGMCIGLGLLGAGVTAQAQPVTTKSGRTTNSRIVRSAGWRLWSKPDIKQATVRRKTGKLKGKLVQIDRVARVGQASYLQISRRGHVYGWLNQKGLRTTKKTVLPYTYTSQLYPLYAPNGCEAASLKMALSVKGIATKTSLKTIINKMPKAKTPKKGFVGNPYTESRPGETRTIYPKPLTAYTNTFDARAVNITGATKNQLIREIKRGNAVIFAGAWRMQGSRPYHVLTLVGYQRGQFLVADPYMKKSWPNKVYWTGTRNFMKVYQSRHSRAIAVR